MSDLAEFGLTDTDAEFLLDVAVGTLVAHFGRGAAPDTDPSALPARLGQPIGAFVTLRVGGELNGCIGHLTTGAPIVETVAELAIRSAFHDPRLPALRVDDLDDLEIEISLLSPRHDVPARTRDELLSHLRPGVTGLVLTSGRRSALFLPAVW